MNPLLRILIASAALAWPSADVIPEQTWQGWQPWMLGAPCTLKLDYDENGNCIKVEVDKIDWSKKR
jgi:hypothetical protein